MHRLICLFSPRLVKRSLHPGVIFVPCVCCKTAYGVCRSTRAKKKNPLWPLVMFHHQRTPSKQALFVVHLTRNSFQCGPLYRQHGREGGESLLQQRHSRYFTINVKPLLFVIGNTWLGCRCCCRCHILICSPLWKTLASINFTFMVCTHNKWVWGVVVYQRSVLLSNL